MMAIETSLNQNLNSTISEERLDFTPRKISQMLESQQLFETLIRPLIQTSLETVLNRNETMRTLLSEGLGLAIKEQEMERVQAICKMAYERRFLLAIDYDALRLLVEKESVPTMKQLVESLVQFKGDHNMDDTRNLMAQTLLQGGVTGSKATSLDCTTFILKVLERKGKLDTNLLSVITKL